MVIEVGAALPDAAIIADCGLRIADFEPVSVLHSAIRNP
jgi:hypothetical protein